MFKNKYRVVQDNYAGFEAQVKFWWFPVRWWQLCRSGRGVGINTYPNLHEAESLCRVHARKSTIYKVEV